MNVGRFGSVAKDESFDEDSDSNKVTTVNPDGSDKTTDSLILERIRSLEVTMGLILLHAAFATGQNFTEQDLE